MFFFLLCVWQVEDLPIVASRLGGVSFSFLILLFLTPCLVKGIENFSHMCNQKYFYKKKKPKYYIVDYQKSACLHIYLGGAVGFFNAFSTQLSQLMCSRGMR